jgi:hypothetical protein
MSGDCNPPTSDSTWQKCRKAWKIREIQEIKADWWCWAATPSGYLILHDFESAHSRHRRTQQVMQGVRSKQSRWSAQEIIRREDQRPSRYRMQEQRIGSTQKLPLTEVQIEVSMLCSRAALYPRAAALHAVVTNVAPSDRRRTTVHCSRCPLSSGRLQEIGTGHDLATIPTSASSCL